MPLWLLVVLAVAVAILVAVGSILVANRILASAGTEHNSAISPFITVVGLVYGALLGFTVVVSWQQFSSAGAVVADEASRLTTMYGQTVAMPEPERTQLRQLLRQYATSVAGPEWDKQGGDGTGDGGRSAIIGMHRVIGGQPADVASSPINGAFLSQLSGLASDRATRMIDAKPRIPPLLFAALIFGGAVLVTLTGFLRMGSTLGHIMVSSAVAVLLGLLLCIIFSLDHPFGSERGITPAPFQHALQVFDAIDVGK
jgi:hypothetical protein